MSVQLDTGAPKTSLTYSIPALAKAVVAAIPAIAAPDPATLVGIASNSLPNIVEIISPTNNIKEMTLSQEAWSVVRSGFVCALTRFLIGAVSGRKILAPEMTTLVQNLIQKLELQIEQTRQVITADHFISPLRIQVVRELAREMPR